MADLRERGTTKECEREEERERERGEERREEDPRRDPYTAPPPDGEGTTIDPNGELDPGAWGNGGDTVTSDTADDVTADPDPGPEADPDGGRPEARDSLDVFATAEGSPADHTGMRRNVEEDHLFKPQDHVARVGEGTVPGMRGEGLGPNQGAVDIGYDPGSVAGGPVSGGWQREQDDSPFNSASSPTLETNWEGSLADNPSVVGASREEEALAAADPDLTGIVDMDGIANGQVGGTIDGRTPDGSGISENPGQGFQATSGWSGGDTLEGANAANALTNPHNAADAVMKGIQSHGHGNFLCTIPAPVNRFTDRERTTLTWHQPSYPAAGNPESTRSRRCRTPPEAMTPLQRKRQRLRNPPRPSRLRRRWKPPAKVEP